MALVNKAMQIIFYQLIQQRFVNCRIIFEAVICDCICLRRMATIRLLLQLYPRLCKLHVLERAMWRYFTYAVVMW